MRIPFTCLSPAFTADFGINMKPLKVSILLILSVVVLPTSQSPLSDNNDNPENLSGGVYPLESSFEVDYTSLMKSDITLVFPIFRSTFTVILSTVTSTAIVTSITTCTTSASSLKACSSSGRRRRSLESQGFLHDENEENRNGDRTILSPPPIENEKDLGAEILFIIEPSLNDPSAQVVRFANRYFGTTTIVPTVTKTSTSTVTATCSSITGFKVCGSSGK